MTTKTFFTGAMITRKNPVMFRFIRYPVQYLIRFKACSIEFFLIGIVRNYYGVMLLLAGTFSKSIWREIFKKYLAGTFKTRIWREQFQKHIWREHFPAERTHTYLVQIQG
jgi:hypothetical protein